MAESLPYVVTKPLVLPPGAFDIFSGRAPILVVGSRVETGDNWSVTAHDVHMSGNPDVNAVYGEAAIGPDRSVVDAIRIAVKWLQTAPNTNWLSSHVEEQSDSFFSMRTVGVRNMTTRLQ